MNALTARQQQVLDIIRDSIRLRGYPPTLREIAALLGIRSTLGVSQHLQALQRKGWIRLSGASHGAARGIVLTSRRATHTIDPLPQAARDLAVALDASWSGLERSA